MKTIALISNTEIINKIFTLIANKLMVHLKIYRRTIVDTHCDLIIVDDIFLEDNIMNLRKYTSTLVLLKEDKQNEPLFDFVIEKPFLPSVLAHNLEQILKKIDEKATLSHHKKDQEHATLYPTNEPSEKEITDDLKNFIDSMIDELDENPKDSNESLTISKSQLGHGGVLDKEELAKLHSMITDDDENLPLSLHQSDPTYSVHNWDDLSDIVNQTIDEISHTEKKSTQPIAITLTHDIFKRLTPLLEKLDPQQIAALANKEEIQIELRIKN